MSMTLEAIKYHPDQARLEILNQLLLPHQTVYEQITCVEDAWHAIKSMKVRGAPAIAIVGTLSVAQQLRKMGGEFSNSTQIKETVSRSFDYLQSARPTAVNIAEAAERFKRQASLLSSEGLDAATCTERLLLEMESMLAEDFACNKAIGDHGANHILSKVGSDGRDVTILTHCNTGSLATAGYGTALGVVRSLFRTGRLQHAYCTETRPYNQGARLTAYELVHENIPATLVCDSSVSLLMGRGKVSAVVVGADRIVANGDTANKIGTYQIAIAARHHGIPFYVAAPMSTVDFRLESGRDIVIEERPSDELCCIGGTRIAAEGIGCWNPAFDVTPAELITGGIVTEKGVFSPSHLPRP